MSTQTPIVDTDVHHGFEDESDLVPYVPDQYVERYREDGIPSGMGYGNHHLRSRDDLDEENVGTTPRPEDVRTLLLDEYGVDQALLTGAPAYNASAIPDARYGNAVCRAFNDFTIETWLPADDRLYYCMAINHADPDRAADEIERVGDHPKIVGVLMPISATRPFGHERYDPIYEACEALDLTVTLHLGGGGGTNPHPPTGAGWPTHYVEERLTRHAKYQAHLASYLFGGTFEKFPGLTVAMLESGWGWVPSFLWRMDTEWKAFRAETPWVERPPSEYFEEHVRFNTQPIEEPDSLETLDGVIDRMRGDRTLMFGSDFPHQDFDDPNRTLTHLDGDLRRRIFAENARETFGIPT